MTNLELAALAVSLGIVFGLGILIGLGMKVAIQHRRDHE